MFKKNKIVNPIQNPRGEILEDEVLYVVRSSAFWEKLRSSIRGSMYLTSPPNLTIGLRMCLKIKPKRKLK